MRKEKINNVNLQRLIAFKTGNVDYEDVTEEQISEINELTLFGKALDGRPTGINLEETLELFDGLEELGLSKFVITDEVAKILASLQKLRKLEIVDCDFLSPEFTSVLEKVKTVKLVACKEIPFNIRGQEEVDIEGSNVDFSRLDLEGVKGLKLYGCHVYNIQDITEQKGLEYVVLDGSTLEAETNEKVLNIEVPEGCKYSHRDSITRVEDGELGL